MELQGLGCLIKMNLHMNLVKHLQANVGFNVWYIRMQQRTSLRQLSG
jgi:hypothetical protein